MEGESKVVVSARKYDGAEHRRWSARLIEREGSLLILDATFDREIDHELLGKISIGTVSLEYYWLDRWYNIFRFSEPGGALRNYYCNVNVPPAFNGSLLTYVDLDIDVLVNPDLTYKILDLEEFEQNARRYSYPPAIEIRAHQAVDEIVGLIKARAFPFNQ